MLVAYGSNLQGLWGQHGSGRRLEERMQLKPSHELSLQMHTCPFGKEPLRNPHKLHPKWRQPSRWPVQRSLLSLSSPSPQSSNFTSPGTLHPRHLTRKLRASLRIQIQTQPCFCKTYYSRSIVQPGPRTAAHQRRLVEKQTLQTKQTRSSKSYSMIGDSSLYFQNQARKFQDPTQRASLCNSHCCIHMFPRESA